MFVKQSQYKNILFAPHIAIIGAEFMRVWASENLSRA